MFTCSPVSLFPSPLRACVCTVYCIPHTAYHIPHTTYHIPHTTYTHTHIHTYTNTTYRIPHTILSRLHSPYTAYPFSLYASCIGPLCKLLPPNEPPAIASPARDARAVRAAAGSTSRHHFCESVCNAPPTDTTRLPIPHTTYHPGSYAMLMLTPSPPRLLASPPYAICHSPRPHSLSLSLYPVSS
jgi:hypothetical protein